MGKAHAETNAHSPRPCAVRARPVALKRHRPSSDSRGAAGPIAAGGAENEAAASLAAALREGPLTILALGPLTNIAAALRDNPALSVRVERVVAVMGRRPGHLCHPSEGKWSGLLFGHGPVFSDLNFRKDPAAVRYLLSKSVPLTLIPYEVARDVLLTPADMERLAASGPAGAWIARGARGWMEFWRTARRLLSIRPGCGPFRPRALRLLLRRGRGPGGGGMGAGMAVADRQRRLAGGAR
jgi:hypothetical protein